MGEYFIAIQWGLRLIHYSPLPSFRSLLAAADFYWLQRAQMKTACRHLNTIDVRSV